MEPLRASPPDEPDPLAALTEQMRAGRVRTLAVVDSNPLYSAPADLGFREAFERVETRIHAGLYFDETAAQSHWHAPLLHDLDGWSDALAPDGLATILQPLVVRSSTRARGMRSCTTSRRCERVRLRYRAGDLARRLGRGVRRWLDAGAGARFRRRQCAATGEGRGLLAERLAPAASGADRLDGLLFRPDASVWDGRLRTSRGFRNCRSRSRSSLGTTPSWSALRWRESERSKPGTSSG